MKSQLVIDSTLNIVLPLCFGALIYMFADNNAIATWWIRSYIPDGLWAYAFVSAVLIVWQRERNLLWLFLVIMAGIIFEWMQFKSITPGTGDILDIFIYLFSFLIALFLNPFFKQTFKYQNT
jgi:hypothetical protein